MTPKERLIVWKMHKEKHFLGLENTLGILRDASKVDTRTYIFLNKTCISRPSQTQLQSLNTDPFIL